jgi:HK97 gp10 family phage protein
MAKPRARRGGTKARVDVSDLDNWEATLRDAAVEIERVARRLEAKYADKVAALAKEKAPRNRGTQSPMSTLYGPLASKIAVSDTGTREGVRKQVSIGTAFYGIFLERGTARIRKRPFLAPAVRKVRPAFRDEAIAEAMRILGH